MFQLKKDKDPAEIIEKNYVLVKKTMDFSRESFLVASFSVCDSCQVIETEKPNGFGGLF